MPQRFPKRPSELREPTKPVLDFSMFLHNIPDHQKVKLRETDETISFLIIDLRLPGSRIMYVSAGFEALTGYSRDEVIGKNLYQLF